MKELLRGLVFFGLRALIGGHSRRPLRSSTAGDSQASTDTRVAALVQFHAAEYASERNSVDVWKTLQYALVPIALGSWALLVQIRSQINEDVFWWACAGIVPLSYIAYQKAMVDALTGVLLIR